MRKRIFSLLLLLMILVILAIPTTIWAALPTNEELASNDMRIAKGLGQLRSNDMRIINGLSKFRENDMRIIKGLVRVTDQDNKGARDTTARLVIYRMVAADISRAIEWQVKKPVFTEKNLWADIKAAPAPVSTEYLKKHITAKELPFRYAEAAMIYPKQLATSWLEKAGKAVDDGIKACIRREIAREVAKNASNEEAVVKRVVAAVLKKLRPQITAAQDATKASAKSAEEARRAQSEGPKIDQETLNKIKTLITFAYEGGKIQLVKGSDLDELKVKLFDKDGEPIFLTLDDLCKILYDEEGDPVFAPRARVDKLAEGLSALSDGVAYQMADKDDLARARIYRAFLKQSGGDHEKAQERLGELLWKQAHIIRAAYACLLEEYNDHLKVQEALEEQVWTSKLIEKAAKQNGGKLLL